MTQDAGSLTHQQGPCQRCVLTLPATLLRRTSYVDLPFSVDARGRERERDVASLPGYAGFASHGLVRPRTGMIPEEKPLMLPSNVRWAPRINIVMRDSNTSTGPSRLESLSLCPSFLSREKEVGERVHNNVTCRAHRNLIGRTRPPLGPSVHSVIEEERKREKKKRLLPRSPPEICADRWGGGTTAGLFRASKTHRRRKQGLASVPHSGVPLPGRML